MFLSRVSSRIQACLEYLLKNDVLSTLERLADQDRPFGIKAEVLNAFNLLVALLDERFLLHNAVSLMPYVEYTLSHIKDEDMNIMKPEHVLLTWDWRLCVGCLLIRSIGR